MGILKRKNQIMKIKELFLAIGLVSTKPLIEHSKEKILSRQRRFFDFGSSFGSAADWAAVQEQAEANAIARADHRNNIAQTNIMISELAETRRGNRIAERANTLSEQANHIAEYANKANDLDEAQMEQDYAIAMLTIDMEGRVAQMT